MKVLSLKTRFISYHKNAKIHLENRQIKANICEVILNHFPIHKFKDTRKDTFSNISKLTCFFLELCWSSRNLASVNLGGGGVLPTFSGMVFEFQRTFREPRLQGAGRSIMSSISLSQASIIKRLLSPLLLSHWSPKVSLYSCLFLSRAPDNHPVISRRGLRNAVRPRLPRYSTQPSGTLAPLKTLPGKLAQGPCTLRSHQYTC